MERQAAKNSILVCAEDDKEGQKLNRLLSQSGYDVIHVQQDETAFREAQKKCFDAVLLPLSDVIADTLELAARMHNIKCGSQIVLVGDEEDMDALSDEEIRMSDALIRRPYTRTSLLHDITSLLNREMDPDPEHICTGRVTVCTESKTVMIDNQPVEMDPIEYALLEILSQRKNYTLSKEKIMTYLFGEAPDSDTKLIDMYIYRLRKKLQDLCGENYIHTKWEGGYMFADPSPQKKGDDA